jgi:hypothetical protein
LPSQAAQFQQLVITLDHWRAKMQVAWERKSKREFLSRLEQWKHYINDLRLNPEENIPFYESEVRLRLLLDLLEPEIGPLEDNYVTSLHQMDNILKTLLAKGAFVWELDLSPGFDQDTFWYLWGKPKVDNSFIL